MQEKITIKPDGKIYLNLLGKSYKPNRYIGYIENKTFHTVRNPENQFFKNLNAIGINCKFLKLGGKYFDFIKIEYGFEILETSREYFLEFGEYKHFKSNKLDKQIFLNLELFGLDKVSEWNLKKTSKHKQDIEELNKVVEKHECFQEELF